MHKHLYVFFLFFLIFPFKIYAIYDPLSVSNNTYGIHIVDPNDIPELPALVNSSGGDWGYVTLVIQENDRDIGKWQGIFDQMRRLHLIPLVRLATHPEGPSWTKPSTEDVGSWMEFLSKLNWPIQNRYIVLFNEPNHAKEWGNTIQPEEYAGIAFAFAQALKTASDDFFVLPAGLDGSASSNSDSLDESEFLRRMYTAKPELFTILDGWTSHAYPNPAFSGTPYATGKGTIRGYLWELEFLRQLGVLKTYPVFITETGWIHAEGKNLNTRLHNVSTISEFIQIAASSVWKDPKIIAVTPFLFNYQDEPFDHFSWRKYQSIEYYDQFYKYQSITKIKAAPSQIERYTLDAPLIPDTLVSNASYTLRAKLINEGQSIVDEKDGFDLLLDTGSLQVTTVAGRLPYIEPKQSGDIVLHIKIPPRLGSYTFSLSLRHNDRIMSLETKNVSIVPPPKASVYAQLGWKRNSNAKNITVLVYDIDTDVALEIFRDITMSNGIIQIPAIESIIPEKVYRVVVLVPSYLPRQAITRIHKDTTDIKMKRLWPVDFDRDGKLSIRDVWALFSQKPAAILQLFI